MQRSRPWPQLRVYSSDGKRVCVWPQTLLQVNGSRKYIRPVDTEETLTHAFEIDEKIIMILLRCLFTAHDTFASEHRIKDNLNANRRKRWNEVVLFARKNPANSSWWSGGQFVIRLDDNCLELLHPLSQSKSERNWRTENRRCCLGTKRGTKRERKKKRHRV